MVVTAKVAVDESVALIFRVMTSRVALNTATVSGNKAATWKAAAVGRSMISTPRKPVSTAHHRRHPTRSPSRKAAIAVRISGEA